jgi:hypothetical protein
MENYAKWQKSTEQEFKDKNLNKIFDNLVNPAKQQILME